MMTINKFLLKNQ